MSRIPSDRVTILAERIYGLGSSFRQLQTVPKEFDPVAVSNKAALIRYFRDGLKPSIRSQNDKQGRDLDNWEEAIEKAINNEVKSARLSHFPFPNKMYG